jgi:hypothetical protein
VLGQHVELAYNPRQLSISGGIERESNFTLARDLGFDNVSIIGVKPRTVLFERLEGKHDILRPNRGAVMPSCLWAQTISHPRKIAGIGDRFREQSVCA